MRRDRVPAINGWEQDWTSLWHRMLHFRPGTGKYIKRSMNKRARRAARRDVAERMSDG